MRSARGELDKILVELRQMLGDANARDVDGDHLRSLSDRASVLRTALTSIRLLAHLTGELGASETVVATSPHWKRLEGELLEVLKRHPAALRDVVGYLEKKRMAA